MVMATRQIFLTPYSDALSDLSEQIRPAVVAIRDGQRGSGSGVVWTANTVVTNHHVVQGETPEIVFADGRKATGTVIARDPRNDIVALQVDGAPEPVTVGESLELRVGQLVLAMGHPLGVENAVTAGIISALPTARDPRALIRSDLHLLPGNSGGPLLDARGEVIGINSMVAGPGTALSVPSNTVQALLANASGRTPHLGLVLTGVLLPSTMRARFGKDIATGLLVTDVEPGSRAEAAGVFPGDIVIGVGDQDARYPLRLGEALAHASERHAFTLRMISGGELHEVDLAA
jgi:S1-C subfamily serine protease